MLCDFASHTTDGGITLRVHTPLVRTTRKDKSCFQVGLGWRYDGMRKQGATDGTPRERARTVERVPSAAKDCRFRVCQPILGIRRRPRANAES